MVLSCCTKDFQQSPIGKLCKEQEEEREEVKEEKGEEGEKDKGQKRKGGDRRR